MGISSCARAAVRRVHNESPAAASAYYAGKVAHHYYAGGSAAGTARAYGLCVDQYIAWDGHSGPADLDVGFRATPITFAPGDAVRALAHVVLDNGAGQREARVVLWDELPLDARAAEMIALPVLERVEAEYGSGSTAHIDVWQLAQTQREIVLPVAAQARWGEVQTLLASL